MMCFLQCFIFLNEKHLKQSLDHFRSLKYLITYFPVLGLILEVILLFAVDFGTRAVTIPVARLQKKVLVNQSRKISVKQQRMPRVEITEEIFQANVGWILGNVKQRGKGGCFLDTVLVQSD